MTAPLPDLTDPLTAPHWAEAAEGRLAMQRCDACGYVRWPAARACPDCLADGGTWATLSGLGRIWSYAVYRTTLHPALAGECPYAVALVQLEEGPMLHARIDGSPDTLGCDQPVFAVFHQAAPGVGIPRFRRRAGDGV